MTALSRIHIPDHALLVGRDPYAYADDIVALDGDGCGQQLRFEVDAMLDVIQRRSSTRHAPTRARTMAAELVAPIALVCGTIETVDLIHNLALDWINGLGDVGRFARNLHAGRQHARELLDATIMPPPSSNQGHGEWQARQADALVQYDEFREELATLERDASAEWTVAYNARAVFGVHGATTLSAILDVHRRTPQIVAIVDIDEEGPPTRIRLPEPDLVA